MSRFVSNLSSHCPKCYRMEFMPNGQVDNYGDDINPSEPIPPGELPVSTTFYYRCTHCGQDIVIEKPFDPGNCETL